MQKANLDSKSSENTYNKSNLDNNNLSSNNTFEIKSENCDNIKLDSNDDNNNNNNQAKTNKNDQSDIILNLNLNQESQKDLESLNINNINNSSTNNLIIANNLYEIENKKNSSNDYLTESENDLEATKLLSSKIAKGQISQISLDAIIIEAGYNKNTLKIYFITILKTLIYAFYSTYLVFIIEPFKKDFNLTEPQLEFILSLHYIGLGIGCVFAGYLAKRFTRLYLLNTCYLIILIFHSLIFFSSKKIYVFAFSRLIISMSVSIVNIIQTNIFAEYLPIKFRSFMLNSIWCFYPLGIVCYLQFGKFYYKDFNFFEDIKDGNDLDRDYLEPFKGYIIGLVIAAASHFLFCQDSPRNLLLTNQLDKAKLALEKISNKEFSLEEIIIMQYNLKNSGENKFYVNKTGFAQIFSKRILGFSLLMSLLYLSLNFAFGGLSSIYPSIMKELFEEKQAILVNSNEQQNLQNFNLNNPNNLKNIKNLNESTEDIIKYNFIGFFILFIGAVYSEFKITSKKFTKIFLCLASIIFSFLAVIKHEKFYVFISLSNHLCELCVVMVETYACEIYPTIIKDYAIGFLEFAEGIGGVFSQFGFISIYNYGKFFPVYLFVICIFVSVLILIKLPNDNEKSLDSVIFEEKENTTESKKNYKFELNKTNKNLLWK